MEEGKTFKHVMWGGGCGYGKTCNLSLSWAIKWPSWARTYEQMMEYIKKHYRKNNMEKKKMTKEEAFEYLKDRKIYVNGKSAEIQKKLFEVGFTWAKGKVVSYEEMPFLFTYVNGTLIHGCSMLTFSTTSYSEISAEEILAIEIEEEQTKHDKELYKMAKPIRDYMRKHDIVGRVVVSACNIAVEDLRFIYPNTSED